MRATSAFALVLFIVGTATTEQAQPPQTANLSVALPGEQWALVFDAPGYKIEKNGLEPDGRAYLLAENATTGVILSVYLDKVSTKATIDDCKKTQSERLTQKVAYKREKAESREADGMEIVEYTIPEFQGVPVQQRNFFACIAKDDVYVDIHFSKVAFKPEQEELFKAVLASAHFLDKGAQSAQPKSSDAASGTSLSYFLEGSQYYVKQDFSAAIPPYQKALDAEKQSRKLSNDYWHVLVDNLGMAYGITGDLDRAQQTFDYGISQDSTYPLFYYNLACVAAGRNDMDKTMELLKKAYSYKANTIQNEPMPDARQDDSFKAFMADKRFRDFVDTL
jgi:tetratricopeptide (TPR) repeat protein